MQRFENMDSTLAEFMALSQQWGELHDTVLAKYGSQTRHIARPSSDPVSQGRGLLCLLQAAWVLCSVVSLPVRMCA